MEKSRLADSAKREDLEKANEAVNSDGRACVPEAGSDFEKARKLHDRIKFQGFDISIENRKGSIRHWHDKNTDTKGETKFEFPYGYIRLSEGLDGDQVDVFIGPNEKAKKAYVIHQMKAPEFKELDEDKVMLGFPSAKEAKAAYLRHYDSPKFFGSMTTLPVEEFRKKVYKMKRRMIKAKPPDGQLELPLTKAGPASEPNTTPGYGAGYQPRVTGTVRTMGHHGGVRTAGENVRDDKQKVRADWPPFKDASKRKKKVRKRVSAARATDPVLAGVSEDELVDAAERLDVRGLRQSHDWANKPQLDRVEELQEPAERTDAGKKNLATVHEIGRQRRKTAAGARLTLNPKHIRREQKR
jgi:hypothetical protein